MRSLHLPLFGPMDDITTYFIITKKREKEAELLYTSQSHNATLAIFTRAPKFAGEPYLNTNNHITGLPNKFSIFQGKANCKDHV